MPRLSHGEGAGNPREHDRAGEEELTTRCVESVMTRKSSSADTGFG